MSAFCETEIPACEIDDAKVFKFVTKPWKMDELRLILRSAAEHYVIRKEMGQTKFANEKQPVSYPANA